MDKTGNQKLKPKIEQVLFAYANSTEYILTPSGMDAQEFIIRNERKFSDLEQDILDVSLGVKFGLKLKEVNGLLEKINEQGTEFGLKGLQGFLKYTMHQAMRIYLRQPDANKKKARKYARYYGIET